MTLLEAKDLVLPYGTSLQKKINFKFESYKPYVLFGPSGSGKTTFYKLVAGYVIPKSGYLLLNNDRLPQSPDRRRLYLSQDLDLFPWWSIEDQLRQLPMRPSQPEIENALRKVGYQQSTRLKPDEISKGMQKKVSLARAFLLNPKILILDETMSSLDSENRNSILEELKLWQKQQKNIVIFISHFASEFNGSEYAPVNFLGLTDS